MPDGAAENTIRAYVLNKALTTAADDRPARRPPLDEQAPWHTRPNPSPNRWPKSKISGSPA